jgi:hypothetical protein
MASHNADRKSEEIARVSLLIQSQHTRIALFCLQAGRKSEAAVCTKGHIKESAWSVGPSLTFLLVSQTGPASYGFKFNT